MTKNPFEYYKIEHQDFEGNHIGYIQYVSLDIQAGWESLSCWDSAFDFSEEEKNEFLAEVKPPLRWSDKMRDAMRTKFVPIKVDDEGNRI